jgi:hypothetical protein
MDNDRVVWGCINSNGSTYTGKGFTVVHSKKGFYRVTYDQGFPKTPAVVLTQNYPNWNPTNPPSSGATLDNSVLVASNENWFDVKTGDRFGDPSDRNFTFIAAGWEQAVQ